MASVDKIRADIERMAEKLAKAQAREALKANRERAKQASAERKAANRMKYELGGLVLKAGLDGTDRGVLLGALLELASTISDDKPRAAAWKQAGDAALAGRVSRKDG